MVERVGRLGVPFAIFVACVACVLALGSVYGPSRDAAWLDPYCQGIVPAPCPEDPNVPSALGPPSPETRARAFDVVKARFDAYRSDLSSLRTNLWLQLSFMLLALIVVVRVRDKQTVLEIPLTKIEIPVDWCLVVVPFVLTYLYIAFGFLFDHLIQERYILWLQLEQLESPRGGRSIHSLRLMLDDRWVMDSWFAEFHPEQSAMPATSTAVNAFNRLLLVGFALVVAVHHALTIFLLSRYEIPGGRRSGLICTIVVCAFIGSAHLAFLIFGGNPNWFQLVVGGASCVILAVLTMYSPFGWGSFRSLAKRAAVARARKRRAQQRRRAAADAASVLHEKEAEVAARE